VIVRKSLFLLRFLGGVDIAVQRCILGV